MTSWDSLVSASTSVKIGNFKIGLVPKKDYRTIGPPKGSRGTGPNTSVMRGWARLGLAPFQRASKIVQRTNHQHQLSAMHHPPKRKRNPLRDPRMQHLVFNGLRKVSVEQREMVRSFETCLLLECLEILRNSLSLIHPSSREDCTIEVWVIYLELLFGRLAWCLCFDEATPHIFSKTVSGM